MNAIRGQDWCTLDCIQQAMLSNEAYCWQADVTHASVLSLVSGESISSIRHAMPDFVYTLSYTTQHAMDCLSPADLWQFCCIDLPLQVMLMITQQPSNR